jgi:hypothetical protein
VLVLIGKKRHIAALNSLPVRFEKHQEIENFPEIRIVYACA